VSGLWIPNTLEEYSANWEWIKNERARSASAWEEAMRWFCLEDLFFLINYVLSTSRVIHSETKEPFFFHDSFLEMCKLNQRYINRCESSFDGSARRGGKSTVRTFAGAIQIGMKYPESSQCIFSVERKLARKHLRVIKEELETNKLLRVLFSDRLWDDPIEATKTGECVWSLEDGLRLKRDRVRNTQTFEQQGYMRGAPTGAGYDVLHFDDAENESVTATPELLDTLHESFASAVNLATPAVLPKPIIFVTNTLYHSSGVANLVYQKYKEDDPDRVRMVPGEDLSVPGDGPLGGTPIYPYTLDICRQKFDEMTLRSGGKDEYAKQICCSFLAGQDRTFSRDLLNWYTDDVKKVCKNKNIYVCIDASKGIIDPMGIWVWAAGSDKRLYWVGGLRRYLDPAKSEFHDEIFNLVSKFANISERVVEIRVEQMYSQTWAEMIASNLRGNGVYIPVVPCRGKVKKTGRFQSAKQEREWAAWAPALQKGEVLFPKMLKDGGWGIKYKTDKGSTEDLVEYFLDHEFDTFPRSAHDDLLDAGALIWDTEVNEERPIQWPSMGYSRSGVVGRKWSKATWMSA
jgi:hypothetical protein